MAEVSSVIRLVAEISRITEGIPNIQTQTEIGSQGMEMNTFVQKQNRLSSRTSSSNSFAGTIPASVHETLHSPGQPLDAAARGFMEPRFGRDFSRVRVHADTAAANSAQAVNAAAFTFGRNMVFGAGRYEPGTPEGQRLLAHELAHTLQQPEGPSIGVTRISDPGDSVERDADRVAGDVIAEGRACVAMTASAGTLYRQPLPGFRPGPAPHMARAVGSELLDSFPLEKHTLTDDQKKRLAIFAQTLLNLLREYPDGGVLITGHTDATGDDAYNDQLGQQRAEAVMDFLIEAGVPVSALSAISAGEHQLLVQTKGPEPRNRRVEVRFETVARGGPRPGLTPVKQPEETKQSEENTTPKPPQPAPQDDPGTPAECSSATDCSSVSVDRFDKQPAALRNLIKFDDPEGWFNGLAPDLRTALTSIFNRLCRYGLLCQVRFIVKIDPGEAPISFLDHRFNVPGKTPSVYFMSPVASDWPKLLLSTGRFCLTSGLGASQHPGASLREISGSDSLHISVEGKDQIEAHIDHYSPVPGNPDGTTCSNEPSPAAVGHIGRELMPEKLRKLLGIPGIEVFPEPAPPAPVPEGVGVPGPVPEIARITLHGPVKERPKRDAEPLPADIEHLLDSEIPARIRNDVLIPPGVARQLVEATRAREMAGPDEEAARVAALEAARERLQSFASEAHDFAQDMARRMARAGRTGRPDFAVQLGPAYAQLAPDDRKYVLDQIRNIARIVRGLLAERAAGVHKIWVAFGEDVMWDLEF
jgi:outer membrane protein OmpA-like peptidoglycan-associated protein